MSADDPCPPNSLADLVAVEAAELRRGAALSVLANLLWIAQAGAIAMGLQALAADGGLMVTWWMAALMVASVARSGLDMAAQRRVRLAARRVVSAVRAALGRQLARRAPDDMEAAQVGALAALAGEKLELLVPWLVRYGPARLRVMVVPACLLVVAAWLSWIAALILLIAGPLIPVFMALVGMAARQASERHMAEIGSLNGLMLDRVRGLLDIRLLDAATPVAAAFDRAAQALARQTMAVLRIAFLSSAVLELFAALGVAMVAVYVGFNFLGILPYGSWGGPLDLGAGVFVLMLAPEFFQPLRDLAAAWHDRAAAQAVARDVDAVLDGATRTLVGTGAEAAPLPGSATVALTDAVARGVVFPARVTVAPGERIAVTGASGAGKSTLLAVVAGLLAVDAGTVQVAGTVLDDATADAWRRRVAWIGQRPYLFPRSLRANVALAGDPADLAGVTTALETAAAIDMVRQAPRGLDTVLGEAGEGLSGGEGRRIAVARAAYQRADVILADEPTADLDAETALAVTRGLLALAESGATLIVATHDPVLIGRMSREIRLDGAAAS